MARERSGVERPEEEARQVRVGADGDRQVVVRLERDSPREDAPLYAAGEGQSVDAPAVRRGRETAR